MLLRQSRCGLSWLWAHWLLLLMMLLLMPLLLTVYSTHWRWGGFCSVSFMCLQFSARPHDKCSIVPAAGVGLSCLLLLFLCFPLKCDCASSAATLLLGWQEQHLVCNHPAVSSMHSVLKIGHDSSARMLPARPDTLISAQLLAAEILWISVSYEGRPREEEFCMVVMLLSFILILSAVFQLRALMYVLCAFVILNKHYLLTYLLIIIIISIPSPCHSFIPGSNPSHRSLPFLLEDWLHGFPGLFTYTSEHTCFLLFSFLGFFALFRCWFRTLK